MKMVSIEERLPTEVVLDLAEHMDIASLKHFMATNKNLRNLIKRHERSISAAKISAYLLPPIDKNILSSSTIERHVLAAGTFHVVAELERREQRVDELLRHSTDFLDILASPAGLGLRVSTAAQQQQQQQQQQQDKLVALLWKALYHCDRVADIAANLPPCEHVPPARWELVTAGAWMMPEEDFPEEMRGRDPCANPDARPAQIAYIRALPAQDVLMVFYLVAVCGAAFSHKRRIYESSDPAALERVTVFEECVLRHGTYFLWSYVRSPRGGEMDQMSSHLLAAGLKELTEWESGTPGVQAGLRMTLLDRFREACVGGDDEEGIFHTTQRMFEMVGDLICGPKDKKKDLKEDAEDDEDAEDAEAEAEGNEEDVE